MNLSADTCVHYLPTRAVHLSTYTGIAYVYMQECTRGLRNPPRCYTGYPPPAYKQRGLKLPSPGTDIVPLSRKRDENVLTGYVLARP